MAKAYRFNNKVIECNEANTKVLLDTISSIISYINYEITQIANKLRANNLWNKGIKIVKAKNQDSKFGYNIITNMIIPDNIKGGFEILNIETFDTSQFSDDDLNNIEIVSLFNFTNSMMFKCAAIFSNVRKYADERIDIENKKNESFDDFSSRVRISKNIKYCKDLLENLYYL